MFFVKSLCLNYIVMFSNNINKLGFTYDNYLPSLFEGLHAELATFQGIHFSEGNLRLFIIL